MQSEREFLDSYRIEDFDRPSVTTDVVTLMMREKPTDSFRKEPETTLSVLLIRRGQHPCMGAWALPGGFVQMDETVEECAVRGTGEKTGVTPSAMIYTGVYSAVDRDPRGRIISNAFTCILSGEPQMTAGSDASDARWFDVHYAEDGQGGAVLKLTSDDIVLSIGYKEERSILGVRMIPVLNGDSLAFDHAEIIADALRQLREGASRFGFIFDFLPEEFTLNALQKVQETITGIPSVPANFRRKVADFVEETDHYTSGAGHRPAKLYRKKQED